MGVCTLLLTPGLCATGFKEHAVVIQKLVLAVTTGIVEVTLAGAQGTNVEAMQQTISSTMQQAFPHLTRYVPRYSAYRAEQCLTGCRVAMCSQQIRLFVVGLVQGASDLTMLKNILKDFVVQIRQFRNEGDDADAYLEERELQRQMAEAERRRAQQAIPGMLRPEELDDDA
jgi:hypothetical protein